MRVQPVVLAVAYRQHRAPEAFPDRGVAQGHALEVVTPVHGDLLEGVVHTAAPEAVEANEGVEDLLGESVEDEPTETEVSEDADETPAEPGETQIDEEVVEEVVQETADTADAQEEPVATGDVDDDAETELSELDEEVEQEAADLVAEMEADEEEDQ